MHLTVLSRRGGIYTTRRIVEAARLRGARARVIDPIQVELRLDPASLDSPGAPGKSSERSPKSSERSRKSSETSREPQAPPLVYRGRAIPPSDVLIPRIAPSIQAYALAVLEQFALLGVPALNGAEAIARSRNKMSTLQRLAKSGVPVPRTVMAREARELRKLVHEVGGPPVLIKLIAPGERSGVMVCETLQSMEAALEAVLSLGHDLLVQRWVRKKRERDLRALVVGGRAVAWVQRRARPGKLLHTLARGAQLKAVKVPAALDALAARAAQVLELELCAVDLIETDDGPRVFDVHSSPGIEGMESATGRDLALPIVARAEELARRAR